MLSLLALSAPGHKKQGYTDSLVNNFYKSQRFIKNIGNRRTPFKPNVKVNTEISKYSACDADLTADEAESKIRNWFRDAIKIVPRRIKYDPEKDKL